ncbi:MAG: response regulator [Deltaproteobacteria bacterium]|nr:response regulator [Deltaproteobacteria bacterium]
MAYASARALQVADAMWSSLELRPEQVPLIAILGGVLFQLAQALIVNRGLRVRASQWWVGIVAVSAVFLAARLVHRATTDPAVAVVAIRVQFVVGVSIAVLATGALEGLLGYARTSRALRVLAAVALPLALITLATPWIVGADLVVRRDVLGGEFFAAGRPNVLVLGAFYVAASAPLIRRMRALPTEARSARRNVRIGAVLLLGTGLNDTLMSAGVVTSIHLFEYAFVFISVASTTFLQRRIDEQQRDLERAVGERTAELETHRRSLEIALDEVQRGEARYRTLAGSTSEAVVVLDGPIIVDVNRAFTEVCRPTGEATGRALDEVLGAALGDDDRAALAGLVRGDAAGPIEIQVARADGAPVSIEVRAPAVDGARRVLLMRDLSGQKELQRQLLRADRLAAMGTLAAGTAHEINNPLSYVLTNAHLLIEQLTPGAAVIDLEGARELVTDIVGGAERIQTIVRDLMALARDRADHLAAVDVRKILDGSLAIVGNQLRYRATIVRRYADDVPPVVGNEVRLGQVFLNLLVNAADALPEGHAAAHEVGIEVARGAEDMVVVRVRDTGSGMTPAVRDRIFDPFYTTKDVGRGTGLGLSVSLGIVTALGGRIEVQSAPGRGSTFAVFLKAAPVASATPLAAPEGGAAPRAGRVLLVDDEPLIARTLARLLAPMETELAHSGRAALDACARTAFDAIVCDLMMPDLTGMDVHEHLVARAPDQARRMVFVTGGVFTARAEEFLRRVPNTVLDKPVTARALRAAIEAVRSAPIDAD